MKATRLILAAAIAATASLGLRAETMLYGYDKEGNEHSVKVTDASSLRFTDTGVSVYEGESPVHTFLYDELEYFKIYDPNSVEQVTGQGLLRLAQNPVSNYIAVVGYTGGETTLTVTSMAGMQALSVSHWNGEPVEAGTLTPGLYILNINNTSIKFIKK